MTCKRGHTTATVAPSPIGHRLPCLPRGNHSECAQRWFAFAIGSLGILGSRDLGREDAVLKWKVGPCEPSTPSTPNQSLCCISTRLPPHAAAHCWPRLVRPHRLQSAVLARLRERVSPVPQWLA
jgi:hypothetical protein